MENQIYNKPMYKCGICGEVYDSIPERMNCEQKCLKKQEEEIKKAAEAKKKEEQNKRKNEVDKAFENAYKLKDAYVNDYGYYFYTSTNNDYNLKDFLNWIL